MKRIFAFFLSFAAAIMFTGAMPLLKASAVTILPTDSSSPRAGCTFLGIRGKYITQIQESIDLINKIRLEACKEGVKNPVTGSPLTDADYVPIQWSADLEYIARLRAAEASVTMDHARTNGESIWFKGPNGVSSNAEVIAWNWGDTMTAGINQWYGEKTDWVNNTGGVTGHYTSMINPNNRYVGLGTFCSDDTRYYNTTAGEFCRSINDPDTSRGSSTGNIIQTLEVKNEHISYEISGSDSLYISAAVMFEDYWSGTLKTENLTLLGDSAKNVKWSSSDNDVVTVSNGALTVKSCGSAVITAKLPDGSSLTRSVSYQHSYETTTTDATCKADGKIVKKCTVCGDTDTQTIPKTNQHSFGNWVMTKAPAASSDGIETRTCTVCGTEETRALRYEPPETSGNANNSSNSGSFATSSNNSSSTSSSSSSSSSIESSAALPNDSLPVSSPNESSSAFSSNNSFAASLPSSTSVTSSSSAVSSVAVSSDEMRSGNASNDRDAENSSDISDNGGSSKIWVPIVSAGGALAAGAAVFTRFYVIRKRK